MLLESIERSYFITAEVALLILSIACQITIGVLYQRLIWETDRMELTKNKHLKQCRIKFSNCYQLNEGNVNIPVFVDKFINRLRFSGLSLTNMTHVSGQLMLLSVFAAGAGACRGIAAGESLIELLPYYIVSIVGLYLYFSAASLVDAKARQQILRTNLIDYLENHMVKHLQLLRQQDMQPYLRTADTEKKQQPCEEETPGSECVQASAKTDSEKVQERQPEGGVEELEMLLREFLA